MLRRLNSNYIIYAIYFIHCGFRARGASVDCTFDDNLCQWNQETSDNFNWTRKNKQTKSEQTGPSSDHTTGDSKGYYIYTEASDPRKNGDVARLLSPMQEAGSYCFKFWYSMYGRHIGTLKVYLVPNNTVIFTKSGNIGDRKWRNAAISYNAPAKYQIIIEGIRGRYTKGDIAVDDISMTPGICTLNCTFDTGLCLWKQDYTDDFDWSRINRATPTGKTGPSADHTSGHGYYIYIETTEASKDERARIISPLLTAGKYCFSIWYYMYGQHVDTLRVLKVNEQEKRNDIYTISGDQGTKWIQRTAFVHSTMHFWIIIEAKVFNNDPHNLGDIAVDDIMMFSCKECKSPIPKDAEANSTNFHYGSAIEITCNEGFNISGSSVIFCQADGTWTDTPTCDIINCSTPIIANGTISGTTEWTSYNQTVGIVCEDGYEMLGNATVTCQADGNWTTLPNCIVLVSENSASKVVYVVAPVVAVILVLAFFAVIWRQKAMKCLAAPRTDRELEKKEKKEKPHTRPMFNNVTYSGEQNEMQSNQGGVLSQDTEYDIITGDIKRKVYDENTVYYNVDADIEQEQENVEDNYDHTLTALTPVFESTYSHVSGNNNSCESNYNTASVSKPENGCFQTDSYDVLDIKGSKQGSGTKIPSNMQDSEYDHAETGENDATCRHLNSRSV